jgi:hypothetical protein
MVSDSEPRRGIVPNHDGALHLSFSGGILPPASVSSRYTSPVSHSQSFEAIVLKTYNVGEADRYCVLLTRERGRMAARANGVRKPTSRMGGSLIPFQHIKVELRESGAGWMVTGAQPTGETAAHATLESFSSRAQGSELLLRLLQDDEAVEALFDATLAFFQACDERVPHALLAFSLRYLHLLGLLPEEDDMLSVDTLSTEEAVFLEAARAGYFVREPGATPIDRLQRVVDRIVQGQLTSPLKAPGVAASMERRA